MSMPQKFLAAAMVFAPLAAQHAKAQEAGSDLTDCYVQHQAVATPIAPIAPLTWAAAPNNPDKIPQMTWKVVGPDNTTPGTVDLRGIATDVNGPNTTKLVVDATLDSRGQIAIMKANVIPSKGAPVPLADYSKNGLMFVMNTSLGPASQQLLTDCLPQNPAAAQMRGVAPPPPDASGVDSQTNLNGNPSDQLRAPLSGEGIPSGAKVSALLPVADLPGNAQVILPNGAVANFTLQSSDIASNRPYGATPMEAAAMQYMREVYQESPSRGGIVWDSFDEKDKKSVRVELPGSPIQAEINNYKDYDDIRFQRRGERGITLYDVSKSNTEHLSIHLQPSQYSNKWTAEVRDGSGMVLSSWDQGKKEARSNGAVITGVNAPDDRYLMQGLVDALKYADIAQADANNLRKAHGFKLIGRSELEEAVRAVRVHAKDVGLSLE